MKAKLDSVYECFTSSERLSLLVEACARCDHVEVKRLFQTAPAVDVRGISKKIRELESFASAVVITLQGLNGAFHAAYSVCMNRDSFASGWLEAGGKAKALLKHEKNLKPDADEIAEAIFARARDAFTIASVYDEVCEQIGFSRDLLVRAFVSPFHAEKIEIELPIIKHFAKGETDEKIRNELLEYLRKRYPILFPKTHSLLFDD